MKKSAKGALAAAAAGTLLLGGAGSLAYWTDSKDVGTANLTSGSITLGAPTCTGSAGLHGWQLDNGDAFVPGTTKLVPGDSISKVCNLTLTLVGAHIGADLSIDTANLTGDSTTLAAELDPSATFTIDGNSVTSVTNPGTYTVQATVSVGFDGPNATNDSQNGNINLDAIDITADQTHTP